jgi:hypothetical protein
MPNLQRSPRSALAALAASAALLLGPAPAAAEVCPATMRPYHPGRFPLAGAAGFGEVGEFCLDVSEVSADDWAACVKQGRCQDSGLRCGKAATYGVKGRGDHPINCVSWDDADSFCRAQGKRLPTEAEWEWAARGALRKWKFPWGADDPAGRACWDGPGNSLGKGGRSGTCPIGATPLGDNPDGVHDLAGNVREWTSSTDGRLKVVRGGSWGDSLPDFLMAGFRGMNAADERFEITGFRCASDQASADAPPPRPVPAPAARPAPRPVQARPAPVAAPAEPVEASAEDDEVVVAPPEDPNAPPPPPPRPKRAPPPKADTWKDPNTIKVDGLQLDLKPGR